MEFRLVRLDDIDNKKYMKLYPHNSAPRAFYENQIKNILSSPERQKMYVLEDMATYELIGSCTVEYDLTSSDKKVVNVKEIRIKKKYQCCCIEGYFLRKVLTISKDEGYDAITFRKDQVTILTQPVYEKVFTKFDFKPTPQGLMRADLNAIIKIRRSPPREKLDITMEIGPIFP